MEMQVIDTFLACWLCFLGSVSWLIGFLYCFLRKVLLDLAHCFQVILAIGGLFDIIPRERERGCQNECQYILYLFQYFVLFLELKRADYVSIVLFTLCYVLGFAKLLRVSGICGIFLVRRISGILLNIQIFSSISYISPDFFLLILQCGFMMKTLQ